jgi:S-disulfanyl-L-cysteine oxidoreductase SoxD
MRQYAGPYKRKKAGRWQFLIPRRGPSKIDEDNGTHKPRNHETRTPTRQPRMTKHRTLTSATLALAASLTAAMAVATAQGGPARTVWDGAYSETQAARGRVLYEAQCAFCHQSDLRGQGFAPALIEDTFASRWQDGNLGDLFTIVKVTMPQDKPASLTDGEYAAIVAYLLKANRYPAGRQELHSDPAALKEVVFKRPGPPK